jgi:hypothetical protein
MQQLDDQARQALMDSVHEDMGKALREVTEDGHVVIRFYAYIVNGH